MTSTSERRKRPSCFSLRGSLVISAASANNFESLSRRGRANELTNYQRLGGWLKKSSAVVAYRLLDFGITRQSFQGLQGSNIQKLRFEGGHHKDTLDVKEAWLPDGDKPSRPTRRMRRNGWETQQGGTLQPNTVRGVACGLCAAFQLVSNLFAASS